MISDIWVLLGLGFRARIRIPREHKGLAGVEVRARECFSKVETFLRIERTEHITVPRVQVHRGCSRFGTLQTRDIPQTPSEPEKDPFKRAALRDLKLFTGFGGCVVR